MESTIYIYIYTRLYGEGHAGVPGQENGLLDKDLCPIPPPEPRRQPLDYTFWPHIEFKACKLRHPNIPSKQPIF
ncbi:Hypothetical protein FKW44_000766 [Caligus rogercresseyi]|uniref:Uncharacterized protein n=1 Tax=Caligus rogercresseyi TaxID=217165 RepID=A0A7T8KHT3_CALRO|nr:Hypothetical protein FKW44_000766 [Caligus rogercresseyi]